MYCVKCGAKIASGTKFCAKCGAPVPSKAEAKPEPKPEVKKEAPVMEVRLPAVGRRSRVGLILIIVGIIILVGAGLFIFKPWVVEEGEEGEGISPIIPGVQKPVGVNFKTFEWSLAQAGLEGKFHVEYPDWTIEQGGKITGGSTLLSIQTKNECWLEVAPAGGEADTLEEAWNEIKESVQGERYEGVNIIKMELDKAKMEGIAEFNDSAGKIISGQPIHLLSKFIFIEIPGRGVGVIAVLFYSLPDKWSEYEDIARYVIDSARIIKGPVTDAEVSEEIKQMREMAYIKSRDAHRLAVIYQLRVGLEIFYAERDYYPRWDDSSPIAIGGKCLCSGESGIEDECSGTTYIAQIPSNPSPRTDGGCPDQDYIYQSLNDGKSYTLKYCLGLGSGDVSAGSHQATPEGVANP